MLKSILGTFLIYSFEIRAGNLVPEDIVGLTNYWLQAALDIDQKSKLSILRTKYALFEQFDNIFPESVWAEILGTGLIPKDLVNDAINESTYYATKVERPDWLQLWDAFELDDESLEDLLARVKERLYARQYSSAGELKHIIGSLLQLSEMGIYRSTSDEIIVLAKANVDEMNARNELSPSASPLESLNKTAYAGRGFHGMNFRGFAELTEYIDSAVESARKASYPAAAENLIESISVDPKKFTRSITITNEGANEYYNIPILAYANTTRFVNQILTLKSSALNAVVYAIGNRYQHFNPHLVEEREWLQELAKQLEPKILEREGTMSGFWIKALRDKVTEKAVSLGAPLV
jgi:hypothetical protein